MNIVGDIFCLDIRMHYYSHDHHGLVAYLAAGEFFVVNMQLPLVGTWVLEYDSSHLLGFWDVLLCHWVCFEISPRTIARLYMTKMHILETEETLAECIWWMSTP